MTNNCNNGGFDDGLDTMYEKTMLKSTKAEDPGDDCEGMKSYVSKKERVGKKHDIAQSFIKELISLGYTENQLDLEKIKRIVCIDSKVTILSIPLKGTKNSIVSYCYDEKYAVFVASIEKDKMKYESAVDGELFVSAVISDNKIYFDTINKNSMINTFSNYVYEKENKLTRQKESGGIKSTPADCCRKESSYTDCVTCSVRVFGVWGFIAYCIAPEILAAIMASCIGAGPNAWC
jgi:hypothetical protein